MRRFRFFFSRLIFERIFRRTRASILGPQIDEENDRYNRNRGPWRCHSCGSSELANDVCGNDGMFSWPHHFYRCKKCGNAQETTGNLKWRLSSQELAKHRLTKDGECYRYIFLLDWQWAALITIFVMAACIMSLLFFVF